MTLTTRVDREDAEGVLTRFYARMGLSRPKFLWFEGPLSCMFALNLLSRMDGGPDRKLGESVEEAFRREIATRTWWMLETQFDTQPELHALKTAGWLEFRVPFELAFFPGTDTELGLRNLDVLSHNLDFVWEDLDAEIARRVEAAGTFLRGFWGGDRGWAAQYSRCARLGAKFDPTTTEILHDWSTLQRTCAWWHPFEHVVLCSDRPREAHWDAAQRLHGEHGPALEFRDGPKLYAWHGAWVPGAWIEQREALHPSTALSCDPALRATAAEIVGWHKVLPLLDTRVIDADPDPGIGTLLECDVPGLGVRRFLRVRCGTGRELALRVPRERADGSLWRPIMTARDANAWTYDLTSAEYQPEVRT